MLQSNRIGFLYKQGYKLNEGDNENNVSFNNLQGISVLNANDRDYLRYDIASQTWKNMTGDTVALSQLTDVVLTNPLVNNQVLKYDGTKWINAGIVLSDISEFNVSTGNHQDVIMFNSNTGKWENKPLEDVVQASNNSQHSIEIGNNASNTADYSINIGYSGESPGFESIALGSSTRSNANYSICVGSGTRVDNDMGIALGVNSQVQHNEAIVLGANSVSTGKRHIQLGENSNSSDAVLNFRTQQVSNENWIDGNENVSFIDKNGHIQKSSYNINVLSSIGSGVSNLNGLQSSTQTFSTGTSGTNFNIVSSGSNHAFNIPDASTSNRGVISTGLQTINGNKIFNNIVRIGGGVITGTSNLQFNNPVQNRIIALNTVIDNDHQYYGLGVNANTLRYQVNANTSNHSFFSGLTASTSQELFRINGTGVISLPIVPANSGLNDRLLFRDTVTGNITQSSTILSALNFWSKTGNAGTIPTTNFIGSTDNVDLVIRTNNIEHSRFTSAGNSYISAPVTTLNGTRNTIMASVNGSITSTGNSNLIACNNATTTISGTCSNSSTLSNVGTGTCNISGDASAIIATVSATARTISSPASSVIGCNNSCNIAGSNGGNVILACHANGNISSAVNINGAQTGANVVMGVKDGIVNITGSASGVICCATNTTKSIGATSSVIMASSAGTINAGSNNAIIACNGGVINPAHSNSAVIGANGLNSNASNSLTSGAVYAGTVLLTCDEKKKKNIEDDTDSDMTDAIMNLKPKYYQWKDDDEKAEYTYGFLADEIEKSFPNCVKRTSRNKIEVEKVKNDWKGKHNVDVKIDESEISEITNKKVKKSRLVKTNDDDEIIEEIDEIEEETGYIYRDEPLQHAYIDTTAMLASMFKCIRHLQNEINVLKSSKDRTVNLKIIDDTDKKEFKTGEKVRTVYDGVVSKIVYTIESFDREHYVLKRGSTVLKTLYKSNELQLA